MGPVVQLNLSPFQVFVWDSIVCLEIGGVLDMGYFLANMEAALDFGGLGLPIFWEQREGSIMCQEQQFGLYLVSNGDDTVKAGPHKVNLNVVSGMQIGTQRLEKGRQGSRH